MNSADAAYPSPPKQVEIRVEGAVLNASVGLLSFRHVRIDVEVPAGRTGSGFEFQQTEPGNGTFSGTVTVDSASTGCVRGIIEIEGYAPHHFEFGMSQIDYGAEIQIQLLIQANGAIVSRPYISASEIQPALAADPVIRPGCVEP